MGKCGTSASINHSRRKAMKKIILSLLAAGLSGTALLHAAEPVKLDQPDLERGAPIMKALSDRQSIRSFGNFLKKRSPKKICQTCSGPPTESTARNPASVPPRPP